VGGRAGRGGNGAANTAVNTENRVRGDATGSGVFGAGTGVKPSLKGRAASAGFAEILDDGSGEVKNDEDEAAASTEKGKGKEKDKAASKKAITQDVAAQGTADVSVPVKVVEAVISDDDEPEEPRRDIERIWLSSDDEVQGVGEDEADEDEDVVDRKGKQRADTRGPRVTGGGGGLRPVRAPRTVVEEEEEVTAKARRQSKAQKRPTAGPETIDVDEMEPDEVDFVRETLSSPDLRKKNLKKPAGKSKDVKFATEAAEDRAERIRLTEDVNKLRQIFAPFDSTNTEGKHGKAKASATGEEQDRLFLLQFPPITPFLTDPNAPLPIDDDEDDVVEVKHEGPAASTSASTAKNPSSKAATGPGPSIKKDPDGPYLKSHSQTLNTEGLLTAASRQRLPAGIVGKLNVHASGKVTLDWGGTDMEVRMGTEVGFLQDAVFITPPKLEEKDGEGREEDRGEADGGEDMDVDMDGGADGENEEAENDGKVRGTVYALGQIEGKMVVVPDWGRLYD
jgi:RNA polymerase III RPC4